MNILTINKFYWMKGGSEAVFFGEKALLEKHGHTVIPFSMQAENNLPSEYARFFVNNVDYGAGGIIDKISAASKIVFSFDARKNIKRMLKEIHPDVAHFHIFQHQISPSVFGPLRRHGVPLVLTLHDLKPMCPNYRMYTQGKICEQCKGRKFYNCTLNKCTKDSRARSLINTVEMYLHFALGYYQNVDRYIAVSHFFRNKMIDYGFSPGQIEYLPNFIDIDQFPATGIDRDYAVFFGRLSHEKGIDTLVQAARLCPDIPVRIIGTGPEEQRLHAEVRRDRINNITFLGYKQGDELKQIIGESSFTVLPSILYENCPMSVLESLAMGKPVIGARIGGIPELIDEGNDGLTFTTGDAHDLADKMHTLWENRSRRLEMGRTGREKIAEKFTPERHYQELVRIYSDVSKPAPDYAGK